jgi:Transglycosylase SLT domain
MRRVLVVLLTVAIGLAGCGSPGDSTVDAQGQSLPTGSAESEPTSNGVAVFGKAPAAKASPSPTRRRSTAAARPAPSPSRRPVQVAGPPAPKPDPVTNRPCPYHEGTDASTSAVKSALLTAASNPYWIDTRVDWAGVDITVPPNLMKAVAWQESGWQSTIIACDGGIGTMQIMPDTATWMNGQLGTSYDVHTLAGNTKIGAAYLTWLIGYFGYRYFDGYYALNAADCADETSPCLLNAVIAAYNYGFGGVDTANGLAIPNPQYVRNVRALMAECKCLSF